MSSTGSDLDQVLVTERAHWVDGPPHELFMARLQASPTVRARTDGAELISEVVSTDSSISSDAPIPDMMNRIARASALMDVLLNVFFIRFVITFIIFFVSTFVMQP